MRSRSILTALISLCAGAAWVSAQAETVEDCIEIQDRTDRLACFDRVFPRRKTASETPAAEAPKESEPVVVTAPVTPPPESASRPSEPEAERAKRERRFGLPELGGLFGERNHESITSRIVAVRARDKQKMVFLLENDQIWIQANPRDVPIEEGELVTVSSTLTGGHMLRTEHGVSTRVNRIR